MCFGQNFPTRLQGCAILSSGQAFLKRLYGLSPIIVFLSTFSIKTMGWTVLSFDQNFLTKQYGLNRIIFWLKFSKKIIWIERYCLLIKIFLKDSMSWIILSFGKNFPKNYMDWTILSFDQNLLKKQYKLKRFVFCWTFS